MLEWVRGDNRLGAGDHYVPHFPVNKRASHLRAHYTPHTLTHAHSQYTQKCPQAIHYHTHTSLFTAMYTIHLLKMAVTHTHITKRSHTHKHTHTFIYTRAFRNTLSLIHKHIVGVTTLRTHSVSVTHSQHQGGRIWKPFGESKTGH